MRERYLAMAGETRGRAAETLRRLAAGSLRLMKKMQSEYYLLTGDRCRVSREPYRKRGMQEDLRSAWKRAGEGERAYLEAASETRDPGLRELYGAGAEHSRLAQRELRALSYRMFQ